MISKLLHAMLQIYSMILLLLTIFFEKHLGSFVTNEGGAHRDVKEWANAAWSKWRKLSCVLCDAMFPRRFKSRIYSTIIGITAL